MTERRDDGGATTVGELAEQRDDVPAPRDRSDDRWDSAEIDDHGELGDRDARDHDLDDTDLDDTDLDDDGDWEPPVARYRPGRGGFDPDAAAAAAHAKYAFRQRLVLALLVLLLAAGATALLVSPVFWWAAGALGLVLGGYLTYLRRQVRIEESIRDRRAARLAGTRRSPVADDPELDGWARRGREAGHETADGPETAESVAVEDDEDWRDDEEDWTADDGEATRVRGTGEPIGVLPARCRTVEGPENTEHTSSLPRITTTPAPPIPAGTSLVDVDDDEELDAAAEGIEHRRAAGQ